MKAAAPRRKKVPHYRQTTDFTCGPAACLMAMTALDARRRMDQVEEIEIWREATTVHGPGAHGGCGALGLALALHQLGSPGGSCGTTAVCCRPAHPLRRAQEVMGWSSPATWRKPEVASRSHHDRLTPADLEAAAADGAAPVVPAARASSMATTCPLINVHRFQGGIMCRQRSLGGADRGKTAHAHDGYP